MLIFVTERNGPYPLFSLFMRFGKTLDRTQPEGAFDQFDTSGQIGGIQVDKHARSAHHHRPHRKRVQTYVQRMSGHPFRAKQ